MVCHSASSIAAPITWLSRDEALLPALRVARARGDTTGTRWERRPALHLNHLPSHQSLPGQAQLSLFANNALADRPLSPAAQPGFDATQSTAALSASNFSRRFHLRSELMSPSSLSSAAQPPRLLLTIGCLVLRHGLWRQGHQSADVCRRRAGPVAGRHAQTAPPMRKVVLTSTERGTADTSTADAGGIARFTRVRRAAMCCPAVSRSRPSVRRC